MKHVSICIFSLGIWCFSTGALAQEDTGDQPAEEVDQEPAPESPEEPEEVVESEAQPGETVDSETAVEEAVETETEKEQSQTEEAKEPEQPDEEPTTSRVYTVETRESPDGIRVDSSEVALVYPPGYLENKRLQTWGHVLLGTGFGAALVGAVLTEVDSWGRKGKVGFTIVGAGIGVMVTGMFLVGLSIPVRKIKPKKQRIIPTVGSTNGVAYEIYF